MLDLLIHNATLPDGRNNMSVAVRDGRIVEVATGLAPAQAPAHEVVDAQGQLLSPPFADAHFHLDATLTYGMPRINQSGTLLEGIALWGELKPHLTFDALVQRALAYCDWAVANGLLAIRSHVDTSDPSLLPVEALLEVKRRVAPYIDLQLVAFPQDGVLRRFDDRRWPTIAVPGNWTTQGWDKPHYTNVQMPYPDLPPPLALPRGPWQSDQNPERPHVENHHLLRRHRLYPCAEPIALPARHRRSDRAKRSV